MQCWKFLSSLISKLLLAAPLCGAAPEGFCDKLISVSEAVCLLLISIVPREEVVKEKSEEKPVGTGDCPRPACAREKG